MKASSSGWFRPTQAGWTNAACDVGFDIETPTFGSWAFVAAENPTVTYDDPGSVADGVVVTFASDECFN